MARHERQLAEKTPDWQWCLNSSCDSGQVHKLVKGQNTETGKKGGRKTVAKARSKQEANEAPFVCKKCDSEFCLMCTAVWHKGETCDEYRARTKTRQQVTDETASQKTISEVDGDVVSMGPRSRATKLFCKLIVLPFLARELEKRLEFLGSDVNNVLIHHAGPVGLRRLNLPQNLGNCDELPKRHESFRTYHVGNVGTPPHVRHEPLVLGDPLEERPDLSSLNLRSSFAVLLKGAG